MPLPSSSSVRLTRCVNAARRLAQALCAMPRRLISTTTAALHGVALQCEYTRRFLQRMAGYHATNESVGSRREQETVARWRGFETSGLSNAWHRYHALRGAN